MFCKPRLRRDLGLNKYCLNGNSLGFWDSVNRASESWKLSGKGKTVHGITYWLNTPSPGSSSGEVCLSVEIL